MTARSLACGERALSRLIVPGPVSLPIDSAAVKSDDLFALLPPFAPTLRTRAADMDG
jgi:hypothetical protein